MHRAFLLARSYAALIFFVFTMSVASWLKKQDRLLRKGRHGFFNRKGLMKIGMRKAV